MKKNASSPKPNAALRSKAKKQPPQKGLGAPGPAASPADNEYLGALLDPERCKLRGIPDTFAGQTHVCRVFTQKTLAFINGKSSGVIRPSVNEVIASTQSNGSFQDVSTGAFVPIGSDELGDLRFPTQNPSDVSEWYAPHSSRKAQVPVNSGSSIAGPILYAHEADNPAPTFEIQSDAGAHLGLPVSSGDTVDVQATFSGANLASASTFDVELYVGIVDSSNNYSTSSQFFTGISLNGSVREREMSLVLPANTVWLTDFGVANVTGTGLTGHLDIHSIQAQVKRQVGIFPELWATTRQGNSITVSNALTSCGSKYRVVAQSAWLQYRGSMTSNGQVNIAFIEDAGVPGIASKAREDLLPYVPTAYSGPLVKGAYAVYRPLSVDDINFQSIENARLETPHIAFAIVANDAAAENVTLRVCTILELQSSNPVFGPKPSPVKPGEVWTTLAAMAYLPTAMENDTHLSKIAGWLRTKGMTASKIAQLLAPMFPTLGIAGKGMQALLEAF